LSSPVFRVLRLWFARATGTLVRAWRSHPKATRRPVSVTCPGHSQRPVLERVAVAAVTAAAGWLPGCWLKNRASKVGPFKLIYPQKFDPYFPDLGLVTPDFNWLYPDFAKIKFLIYK
jgi:hypothetical protein